MDSVRPLTLYELNGLLRETIETTLTGTYWVEQSCRKPVRCVATAIWS